MTQPSQRAWSTVLDAVERAQRTPPVRSPRSGSPRRREARLRRTRSRRSASASWSAIGRPAVVHEAGGIGTLGLDYATMRVEVPHMRDLHAMSDEKLLRIDGIGPGRLAEIRAAEGRARR